MKKMILLVCLAPVFLNSCRIVKQVDFVLKADRMRKKTEKIYNYGEKFSFVLDEDALFIPCKISDTIRFLYYDSKMMGLYEKLSGNSTFPKCEKTIKFKIKNNRKQKILIKNGLRYYNIDTKGFYFKNLVGEVMSISSDTLTPKCTSEKWDGIVIGQEIIPGNKNAMILSFSDSTLTLYDNAYDTTGFKLLKSLNTCQGLSVCLSVDSIEYSFIFDTGSKGFLSLPQYGKHQKCFMVNGNPECNYFDMNYEKHKKENDIPLLNYRKRNTSSIVADTLINQYTNTIKMGTSDFIAGNIMYRNKLVKPVMGMDFISHFDWIIDIQKEKVYVKQIKEIPPVSNLYQVSIMDDTLRISSLPVDDTKYRLFSVIEYINGEKITMDNICRMEKLLNKENGFKENEITISPSSSLRIRSKE